MTYRELYEKTERKLEKGEITSGEFDEMTKPLDEEIRPHGEWEWKAPTQDTICTPHCSYCGHMNEFLLETNFCPNCGADMRTQNDRSWDTSERGVSGSVKNSIAQEEGKEK